MDRHRSHPWLILIAGVLILSSCTLSLSRSNPSSSSQQSLPSRSLASDSSPVPSQPPQPPKLTVAIPSPFIAPISLDRNDDLSDDPVLAEAQKLLGQAMRQAEVGQDHELMPLLTRARALLLTDWADLTYETRHRREQTLTEVDALADELAAIRVMSAIPSDEEAPLVSPEDVSVIERTIPAIPSPWQPEVTYDIPVETNRKVQAYIELFTTKKRDQTAEALERSGQYLPLMRQIFADKGLPQDLVNLAYIESAFKLYAYSRARAVGIWQFMRGTGRKYGLKRNWWVDERRDPVKSTVAAAEYLSDLYAMFESWPLAIAAYNAGEGKVLRATRRQKTTDFWKLKLPRETKFFVPAFMAMTIIAKDPERYGFTAPTEHPWQVDQVTLTEPTDLRLLAKAAGVSTEELKRLNPELRRTVTPPQEGYLLNLPPGSKVVFLDALRWLPQARRAVWRQHRVRRGETLSTIARRFRTTVPVLMEMNRLKSAHRIRAGTRITVPVPALTLAKTSNTTRRSIGTASSYVVQRGDTLWDIARAHRVSTRDLKRWNNLNGSLIRPGRTLRVDRDGPQADPPAWQQHRVRRGETLSTIAKRYRTTVAVLMEVNRIKTPHRIRAGTRITVPVSAESSGSRAGG